MMKDDNALDLLDGLLAHARAAGADACDAVLFRTLESQCATRMLKPESIERSENAALGLRVWVGKAQAVVSSSDIGTHLFQELASRAVSMARIATEDAFSTLAPEELLAREIPDLDLADNNEPDSKWLLARCREAEEAALAVPGVTNSEGADASFGSTKVSLVTRPANGAGFAHGYHATHCSISVSVLAGQGTGMERDYDYSSKRFTADLPSAADIGASAGARAVRRLNPRRVATCQVPIIFDPRTGRGLLASFAGAINGASIARGTSFLKDAMHTRLFAPGVTVVDDPHRPRGLASRPFDAEGVRNARRVLVEDGILQSWILDVRTANKLGLVTTGNASRGVASAPSPSGSNVYLEPGSLSPRELMADIASGFYVTETFGMGVNLVTGDYSQGAAGYWIENGEIAYPVSELTIAGHLNDMLATLTPASDLEFRYATNTPTLRVEKMTVAGT